MSDAFGGYPACCFVAVIAVYGVMHHSISILGGTIGGRARVRGLIWYLGVLICFIIEYDLFLCGCFLKLAAWKYGENMLYVLKTILKRFDIYGKRNQGW